MSSVVLSDLARFGPQRCEASGYADAVAYTRAFARRHRENFHVISGLLPRRLRDDFCAVYAFCRWADDLADAAGGPAASAPLLDWWEHDLRDCFNGRPAHPVFVALGETVRRHDLPIRPFLDLLDAFRHDQVATCYATWAELLNYCRRSANPVGRLVLMMCGYRDEPRLALSDKTCTALQLVNFWQDVRRDLLAHGRIYVPQDVAARHGLDLDALAHAIREDALLKSATGSSPPAGARDSLSPSLRSAYRATLAELVDQTQSLFDEGRTLLPTLAPDVRPAVGLFTLGGEAVLRKVRRINYDTCFARPRVGAVGKAWLLGRAWLAAKGATA